MNSGRPSRGPTAAGAAPQKDRGAPGLAGVARPGCRRNCEIEFSHAGGCAVWHTCLANEPRSRKSGETWGTPAFPFAQKGRVTPKGESLPLRPAGTCSAEGTRNYATTSSAALVFKFNMAAPAGQLLLSISPHDCLHCFSR